MFENNEKKQKVLILTRTIGRRLLFKLDKQLGSRLVVKFEANIIG